MPNPGALRFNTDSLKLELFDGNQWTEIVATSPDAQTGGARGVFVGGQSDTTIDYINISSTGDAVTFGSLASGSRDQGPNMSTSSRTRGLHIGGNAPGGIGDTIDFLTISSTGDTQDFANLHTSTSRGGACASSTRALYAGGYQYPSPSVTINNIQYITIASQGTDAQDFGDLSLARSAAGSFSSSTRAIWAGGYDGQPTLTRFDLVDFVTISTLGNAADFGDLSSIRAQMGALSNSIRGIWGGGQPSPDTNVIEYVTIATLGDAVDFGDLNRTHRRLTGLSSPTRGVFAGGYDAPVPVAPRQVNIIDYIQIMSTGDATDFGDLTSNRQSTGGVSNGHGGL